MGTETKQAQEGQNFDIGLGEIVPEYESKNALVRWLFNSRLRVALSYLKRVQPRSLIDLGCGSGQFLRFAVRSGLKAGEIWGADLNPRVASLNGQVADCRFSVQNILSTDFETGKFDAVASLDVLEHFKSLGPALAEIRRILRPGGWLVTSEPVESALYKSLRFVLKGTYSQESGPGAGVHYHNARQIDHIIRGSGFTREASRQLPFYFPFDLFHVNLYRKNN